MLSSQRNVLQEAEAKRCEPDFHGACILLESGLEIPITEDMVRSSLEAIIKEQEQSQQ